MGERKWGGTFIKDTGTKPKGVGLRVGGGNVWGGETMETTIL